MKYVLLAIVLIPCALFALVLTAFFLEMLLCAFLQLVTFYRKTEWFWRFIAFFFGIGICVRGTGDLLASALIFVILVLEGVSRAWGPKWDKLKARVDDDVWIVMGDFFTSDKKEKAEGSQPVLQPLAEESRPQEVSRPKKKETEKIQIDKEAWKEAFLGDYAKPRHKRKKKSPEPLWCSFGSQPSRHARKKTRRSNSSWNTLIMLCIPIFWPILILRVFCSTGPSKPLDAYDYEQHLKSNRRN